MSELSWEGVYNAIGVFDPYQKPNNSHGRITGLLRIVGQWSPHTVTWIFVIVDAENISHNLASGLLKGGIDPNSMIMTLNHVERIGTSYSPHSSSGGQIYSLENVRCYEGHVIEFTARFNTPKTRGDIQFGITGT